MENRLKRDVGYVGGRVTDLSTCAVEILGEKLSKPTPKLSHHTDGFHMPHASLSRALQSVGSSAVVSVWQFTFSALSSSEPSAGRPWQLYNGCPAFDGFAARVQRS